MDPLTPIRPYKGQPLPDFVQPILIRLAGKVTVKGKFVSMATSLGGGYWLTTVDTVKTTWEEGWYHDILIDGEEVEYAIELPIKPMLLLKLEKKGLKLAPVGGVATIADMLETEYTKLWRIGYSYGVFEDRNKIDFDNLQHPLFIAEGVIIQELANTWFRSPADDHYGKANTFCFHCNFDYPHRIDYGSPVIMANGSLAGILVGGDLGNQAIHQGAVVPIELILPFVRLWVQRFDQPHGFSKTRYMGQMYQIPHYG